MQRLHIDQLKSRTLKLTNMAIYLFKHLKLHRVLLPLCLPRRYKIAYIAKEKRLHHILRLGRNVVTLVYRTRHAQRSTHLYDSE
jgi:hypothetical protein